MKVVIAREGPDRYLIGDTADAHRADRKVQIADFEQGRLFPPKPVGVVSKFGCWQTCGNDERVLRDIRSLKP